MERIVGIVVFLVVAVTGLPTTQPTSEQCDLAVQQETCSSIFGDAITGGSSGGLSSAFHYYCETIPPFVPCLEANKADYLFLLECDGFMINMSPFKHYLSVEDMWNMSIAFLNTANEIACSRTEELVNLIECVKRNKKHLASRLAVPCSQYLSNSSIAETLEIADCAGIYGFTSCVRDELVNRCGTGLADILETVYQDVVIGVLAEGIGC